ncbi:MAG: hypothetical protein M3162_00260 [Thermoproteota archaeon]|nr:hypothetical protein [Thermoproteota archaeon]
MNSSFIFSSMLVMGLGLMLAINFTNMNVYGQADQTNPETTQAIQQANQTSQQQIQLANQSAQQGNQNTTQ